MNFSEDIFQYKGMEIESLKISKLEKNINKADSLKYILVGHMSYGTDVILVKTYHSGTLVVESPVHVKYLAERVRELYGDNL